MAGRILLSSAALAAHHRRLSQASHSQLPPEPLAASTQLSKYPARACCLIRSRYGLVLNL